MPIVEQEKEVSETENKDVDMELKTPEWIDVRSSGPSRGKQSRQPCYYLQEWFLCPQVWSAWWCGGISYMIISWNVRGINNAGKCHEVSSRLNQMKPVIAVLIETRVKIHNAVKVRNKIGHHWQVIDNYEKHNNGRIWVLWNENKINVNLTASSNQYVHCVIHHTNGTFVMWLTAIYGLNTLEQRKQLWILLASILELLVLGCY